MIFFALVKNVQSALSPISTEAGGDHNTDQKEYLLGLIQHDPSSTFCQMSYAYPLVPWRHGVLSCVRSYHWNASCHKYGWEHWEPFGKKHVSGGTSAEEK